VYLFGNSYNYGDDSRGRSLLGTRVKPSLTWWRIYLKIEDEAMSGLNKTLLIQNNGL
jgi:hypothetical protein